MSYKFQRKTIRFRKGRALEITVAGVATPILTAALEETVETIAIPGYNKATFTGRFTTATFEAAAVTELGKMWDVTARSVQCLADNGLAVIA
jgi:hypothetical protein